MVKMTKLSKAKNGDWFSRKAIPADVRDAYGQRFGIRHEERFRLSARVSSTRAMAEFRDWDATISSRIDALRSAINGTAITLTQRQISALTGEWHDWFIRQHEDEPGRPEDWDSRYEALMAIYEKFDTGINDKQDDAVLHPNVQRHVNAKTQELGYTATFLLEKNLVLDTETLAAFHSHVSKELPYLFGLLKKYSMGDFTPPDAERLARFPDSIALARTEKVKLAGMDCWKAFEAWVNERQPAPSTVGRWRAVFEALNDHFTGRDVATITNDEAIAWKGTLVTEKRSAGVVNDVWLTSSVTVFNWLLENKKITANPFQGVRVATPRRKAKVREREFKTEEWKVILKATLQPPEGRMKPQKVAARRWVPWLCAYTGSRPGEMTQLQGSNVYQQDGIWLIDISPEDGTVKGSIGRKVPIHEHLIAQGFLDFVSKTGPGPLFYDPNDRRAKSDDPTKPTRPAYVVTRQKLGEWVRSLGVTDVNISPNHAWRHTFKRRAARAAIEARFRNAYCGHEEGTEGDKYETPTLEDMYEELKKFPRYEVD